jgi:hypothetical protein
MIKKILFSVITTLIFFNTLGQKIISLKQHLYFYDISDTLNKGQNISVQDVSVKFSYYVNDTSILKKLLTKVPEKSKKEIQLNIKKDSFIKFEKDSRVTLFTENEKDSMHQNLSYPIVDGADRTQSQQAYQQAVRERKYTLSANHQKIYLFSNIYYDKSKTYALLLIVKSTVGDRNEQINWYKKQKNEWHLIESIKVD